MPPYSDTLRMIAADFTPFTEIFLISRLISGFDADLFIYRLFAASQRLYLRAASLLSA